MLLFPNWHFCGLKKKHYSCFVENWRMCDWWFFLSVCCSVSNWSVLVLRKRAGREGADLIPLCPVVYPSVPGPLYPLLVVYPAIPGPLYPPGVTLSTTCGQVKYPLWRWAPISTVAPKLLPIAHTFCHFIHQHSIIRLTQKLPGLNYFLSNVSG